MPIYEYLCPACGYEFERRRDMEERNLPLPCPECGVEVKRRFSPPGMVLKGDGWPSKNYRVKRQMFKRRAEAGRRQEERLRDGGFSQPRLAPNVEGERVDSWREAAKLAKSKGKDPTGYERLARKEAKK